MEFTLTDVEDEFIHKDPSITVSLNGDKINLHGEGECTVGYVKMLAIALDILTEDLSDEEQEEIDSWLFDDGD